MGHGSEGQGSILIVVGLRLDRSFESSRFLTRFPVEGTGDILIVLVLNVSSIDLARWRLSGLLRHNARSSWHEGTPAP
jgi:hypothetical protein